MKLQLFKVYCWLLFKSFVTKIYLFFQIAINLIFTLVIFALVAKNSLNFSDAVALGYFIYYLSFLVFTGFFVVMKSINFFQDDITDNTSYLTTSIMRYSRLNIFLSKFSAIFIITFLTIIISIIIPLLFGYLININYSNYYFNRFYGFILFSIILIITFFSLTIFFSYLFSPA
ncbi:hypothetical protein [Spiroplasma eriocheiris]|uniref:Uncharacterized protein n=1 Tax=Spiroplasma eriocheiris TaxID=315358 RepID=A0A0H3XM78_9MOLU|nr:hypothetical protein [Spiroplasma eriocheiris]AHF57535.1 hypothetical protein SPE_0406 [Spiroplasma eriocheiris CCTCC M 207170]AKM53992.1 hypothetical protein SERIO_v1c04130 [Spiroplasma eriocheiris]